MTCPTCLINFLVEEAKKGKDEIDRVFIEAVGEELKRRWKRVVDFETIKTWILGEDIEETVGGGLMNAFELEATEKIKSFIAGKLPKTLQPYVDDVARIILAIIIGYVKENIMTRPAVEGAHKYLQYRILGGFIESLVKKK